MEGWLWIIGIAALTIWIWSRLGRTRCPRCGEFAKNGPSQDQLAVRGIEEVDNLARMAGFHIPYGPVRQCIHCGLNFSQRTHNFYCDLAIQEGEAAALRAYKQHNPQDKECTPVSREAPVPGKSGAVVKESNNGGCGGALFWTTAAVIVVPLLAFYFKEGKVVAPQNPSSNSYGNREVVARPFSPIEQKKPLTPANSVETEYPKNIELEQFFWTSRPIVLGGYTQEKVQLPEAIRDSLRAQLAKFPKDTIFYQRGIKELEHGLEMDLDGDGQADYISIFPAGVANDDIGVWLGKSGEYTLARTFFAHSLYVSSEKWGTRLFAIHYTHNGEHPNYIEVFDVSRFGPTAQAGFYLQNNSRVGPLGFSQLGKEMGFK